MPSQFSETAAKMTLTWTESKQPSWRRTPPSAVGGSQPPIQCPRELRSPAQRIIVRVPARRRPFQPDFCGLLRGPAQRPSVRVPANQTSEAYYVAPTSGPSTESPHDVALTSQTTQAVHCPTQSTTEEQRSQPTPSSCISSSLSDRDPPFHIQRELSQQTARKRGRLSLLPRGRPPLVPSSHHRPDLLPAVRTFFLQEPP